jgi:glycosyltransferase involved in cell wall biosynthesis
MSDFPTISITTPSYNQADFLETAIQSVLSQNYQALEYFVLDGDSTDGSKLIIARYASQLTGWRSEPDEGQTDAIVKGWSQSKGDVLAWLNSDDYYLPGALARVGEEFQKNAQVRVVIGSCLFVDVNGKVIGEKYARNFDLPILLTTSGGVPGQPAVFIRRELLEQIGFPDPDLNFVMDWEYWIRLGLVLKPEEVRILYKPLATVRVWPGTKTLTGVEAICSEHRRVLERLFESGKLSPDLQSLHLAALAGTYYKQSFLEWQAGRSMAARRSLAQARRLSVRKKTFWQQVRLWGRTWIPYSIYQELVKLWFKYDRHRLEVSSGN